MSRIADMDQLINLVRMRAPKERPEDFDPGDAFGGSYDECYWQGVEDGRRQLAAEVRDLIVED